MSATAAGGRSGARRVDQHAARGERGRSDRQAHLGGALLAELVGTFFLVYTGTATAVAAATGRAIAGAAADSLSVALAFGLVLAAMVGALGHVSGAHFNPAVTLGLAVVRRFPWRQVLPYALAQFSGALLGAAATWLTLGEHARRTTHLGATYPADGTGDLRALLVEAFITFLLVFVIVAVTTDARANSAATSTSIGFALVAAVLIGGPSTGGAANPVRALGPMIVSLDLHSAWVYLVGPLLGGVAAALLHDRVVRSATPPEPDTGAETGQQIGA
jgi:MIP family channel proteins